MGTKDKPSFSLEDISIESIINLTAPKRFSSATSNYVKALSFNASAENNSSLKRKIEEDEGSLEEKRIRETSRSSICVSPWEFRRLRADLMESQAQIVKLEDRIDELHKKNKETVIFFDKEKNEMKLQLETNRNTVKDLEYRLHKVRKRELECRSELAEAIKLHESEKLKLSEKILKLEHDNTELKLKLDEFKSEADKNSMELQNEITQLKEDNQRISLNFEEKEKLCESLQTRLTAALEAAKDAEKAKEETQTLQFKLKELESEKAEYEEARKLTIALSEKVLRLPELEKELNSKRQEVVNLRQSIHNKVTLEEVNHDLKIKLLAVEEREKQIPALKAKNTELEAELKKWAAVASDFSSDSTIQSLRAFIENLQEKEIATTMEISNLNASVRSSDAKISSLQYDLEKVKEMNEKLESLLQKLKVEVQVLRKKSILVSRERDSYRQQLDLYEKDLTVTGGISSESNNEMCTQMKERVKTLEESLEEYRKHLSFLETQLKECQSSDQEENVSLIRKLRDEVRTLEDSNKFLSRIRDELENKLETRALKGEYLSPNVKVLHFKDNPVAEAQKKQLEEANSLREECDRLRARVKLLESGEVLDITQKVSDNIQFYSNERVKELEKELDSANLKMQRLKEVYRKTSQEFLDVSYMLLGYRIELVSNNKMYKLCNMYSVSPSDYLMFQQTKSGSMEMLGTPFAESLSDLVDEHLHKGNSIPAFLAAVTLALYSAAENSDEDDDDNDDEDTDNDNPPEEIELD